MDKKKPFLVLLGARDRNRLEMIREIYQVSLADAMRASLVALSRQLGFEKEQPDDRFLNK